MPKNIFHTTTFGKNRLNMGDPEPEAPIPNAEVSRLPPIPLPTLPEAEYPEKDWKSESIQGKVFKIGGVLWSSEHLIGSAYLELEEKKWLVELHGHQGARFLELDAPVEVFFGGRIVLATIGITVEGSDNQPETKVIKRRTGKVRIDFKAPTTGVSPLFVSLGYHSLKRKR